jgi:aryl-alcohol dehydrogenase-like predicted oxidoreductase
MEYRLLGKTGLKVSVIGFGSWAIGGNMWGPQNDSDSIEALNKAIDLGVNFIDTALAYGNGHSEEIIGKVLKNRSETIYIATKIPPLSWPPPANSHAKDAFPKEKIIESVERSLKNLGRNCIDLIQLHSWRANWTNDTDWHETLLKLKKDGKVRYIGISVHDNMEDEALDVIETGRIDTIQVVYNALSQTPQKNLFPKALRHNIGIIARVPLAYGALTGKFSKDTTFTNDDFRIRKYTGSGLDEVLKRVDQFKKIVGSSDRRKLISAALHFALDHDAVSLTIPGIRSAKQAEENCFIFNDGDAPSKETIKSLYNLQKQLI